MDKIKEYIKIIGEVVKESREYKELARVQEIYDNDEDLQVMLVKFNRFRDSLLAARDREVINKDEVLKLQKDMQALYTEIMQNKTMEEYTKVRNDFDDYTEKIHTLLTTELYGEQSTGCSGSCSSCAGCH